jgi:hypothetical protein
MGLILFPKTSCASCANFTGLRNLRKVEGKQETINEVLASIVVLAHIHDVGKFILFQCNGAQ